jgi:hypothetical protein
VKCYVWSMALCGAETWTLRTTDQKRLKSFEMWCWRRMEKISWTDHVIMALRAIRFKISHQVKVTLKHTARHSISPSSYAATPVAPQARDQICF